MHWDLLEDAARSYGGPSLHSDRWYTRESFLEAATSVAKTLRRNVRPGDFVLIQDTDYVGSAIAVFALWRLGAVPVPTPGWWTEADKAAVALRTGAVCEINGQGAITRDYVRSTISSRSTGSQETAIVFCTSGTTGRPKLVAHSSASLLSSLALTVGVSVGDAFDTLRVLKAIHSKNEGLVSASLREATLGLRFMTTSAMSTIAGFALLQRALLLGDVLVCGAGLGAEKITEDMEHDEVQCLQTSAFLAGRLIGVQQRKGHNLNSLVSVGIGGSVVTEKLMAQVENTFGAIALNGYGMTETGGPVMTTQATENPTARWRGWSRVLPGVQFQVDTNAEPVGELSIKSPALMYGQFGLDGQVLLSDPSQYFRTGDLVEVASDGMLRIVGRCSDMIMRGAQRIDPAIIESVIEDVSGIEIAAVVGGPSRVSGEEDVVAVVVVAVDHNTRHLEDEVRRACMSALPVSHVPRRVVVVDELAEPDDRALCRRDARLKSAAGGS